jgi:hypothetical protein
MKHWLVTVDKCAVSWLVQANTPVEALERAHERHLRGEHPEKVECEESSAQVEEVHIHRVEMNVEELLRQPDGEGN